MTNHFSPHCTAPALKIFGRALAILCILATIIQPHEATAQQPPAPTPALPSIAITISPVWLLAPIVQLTGEIRSGEKIGFAAIIGGGYFSYCRSKLDLGLCKPPPGGTPGLDLSNAFSDYEPATSATDSLAGKRFAVFQLGGQFRYYVLGDFRHGMQVGTEILYERFSMTGTSVSGMFAGPFVGYKFTARSGFTFDIQLGVARLGYVTSTGGTSAFEADQKDHFQAGWAPLANFNIGGSF